MLELTWRLFVNGDRECGDALLLDEHGATAGLSGDTRQAVVTVRHQLVRFFTIVTTLTER